MCVSVYLVRRHSKIRNEEKDNDNDNEKKTREKGCAFFIHVFY